MKRIAEIKKNIQVRALLSGKRDYDDEYDYDNWKPDLCYVLYRMAFQLFLDYQMPEADDERRPFVYEYNPDGIHTNVLYKVLDAYTDTCWALEHYHELSYYKYLCSDVPISEYFDIFGRSSRPEYMYSTVFREVARPKTFTSTVPDEYDEKYSTLAIVPALVLYMTERMIKEGTNYHWNHYYCINRSMFEEYKVKHSNNCEPTCEPISPNM